MRREYRTRLAFAQELAQKYGWEVRDALSVAHAILQHDTEKGVWFWIDAGPADQYIEYE